MGLTAVDVTVRNPFGGKGKRGKRVHLLVDSGAAYTVLPESVWKALGLTASRTVTFDLADGTAIERGVGQADFKFGSDSAISPVVLGGPSDAALLGAVTLETLGLVLNPLTRDLQPMRMMLARLRG